MSTSEQNFVQITPFLDVEDLAASVTFFTTILGFKPCIHAGGYAYLQRDNVGIRLLENKLAKPPAGHAQQRIQNPTAPPLDFRRFGAYIDVRNVDQLYAELKPQLDTLPSHHVFGPKDQHYGQRELMVLAPGNFIVAFGHPITKA